MSGKAEQYRFSVTGPQFRQYKNNTYLMDSR